MQIISLCSGCKSAEDEEDEDDDFGHLEDSDSEPPCDDDVGPVLQVKLLLFPGGLINWSI